MNDLFITGLQRFQIWFFIRIIILLKIMPLRCIYLGP